MEVEGHGSACRGGAAGASTGPISITTNYGTAVSADFTVVPPPAIDAFTPGQRRPRQRGFDLR